MRTGHGDEKRCAILAQSALQFDGIFASIRAISLGDFENRTVGQIFDFKTIAGCEKLIFVVPSDDRFRSAGKFHFQSNDVSVFEDQTVFIFLGQDGPGWSCQIFDENGCLITFPYF